MKNGEYVPDGLLTRDKGLAGEKVRYIHIDRQGSLWFCSEYDGVAVFGRDMQRIRLLMKQDGLPDNEVKQIAEDDNGNMWFACRRGVLRMDAKAAGKVASP
jgi:ligand-binding sensor domain-containing protein